MTPLPTTDAAIGAAARTGKSTAPEGMPSSPRTIPKAEPLTAAAATHRTGDRPGDKPQSRPIVPQGTDTTSATKTAQPSRTRRPYPDPTRPLPPPSGLIALQLLRPYPNPHSGFPHHDRLIGKPSQPAHSAHPLQPDPHRDHPTAEALLLLRPRPQKTTTPELTTPANNTPPRTQPNMPAAAAYRLGAEPQKGRTIVPQGTNITSAAETAQPSQTRQPRPQKTNAPERTAPANRALFAATNTPPPSLRTTTRAHPCNGRNQWLPSPGRRTAPAGRAAAGKGVT